MMPVRRNRSGEPINAVEAAGEAWAQAWAQMLEVGTKAVKSNSFLNEVRQSDVEIATTPADTVFKIDKVRVLHYRPLVKPKKTRLPFSSATACSADKR